MSSHSLDIVFYRAKVLNFNEFQLISYFFQGSCLWCCICKDTTIPKVSYIFSYIIFQEFCKFCILHLGLWSILINFCGECKAFVRHVIFFFLAYGCPVIPAPFVEKTIFAPSYYLCSFIEDQLTIFIRVNFWALYSVPLIYVSVLLLILHCWWL